VGFSIVVTIGAAIMAGARFKKWFWVCMNIGLAAATAFIMWLWYQTTFQINALCLFCMIVWVMTITLFVKTTVRNISAGVIPASQSMRESARGWSWFAISLWLILIFGIIVIRFFEVIVFISELGLRVDAPNVQRPGTCWCRGVVASAGG